MVAAGTASCAVEVTADCQPCRSIAHPPWCHFCYSVGLCEDIWQGFLHESFRGSRTEDWLEHRLPYRPFLFR